MKHTPEQYRSIVLTALLLQGALLQVPGAKEHLKTLMEAQGLTLEDINSPIQHLTDPEFDALVLDAITEVVSEIALSKALANLSNQPESTNGSH